MDQVLSVSQTHKKSLSKIIVFPEGEIKVIANGVDIERFSPSKNKQSFRSEIGLDKNDIVIGTVGRLVPVKNQAMLLRAAARLYEYHNNIKVLLIGDGPLENELVALATSLGIAPNVRFLGRRSNVPDILRTLDIFVLPSLSEGMSNTILEAMSCKLPVVATNVGGNSELVVHGLTGLLVQRNNHEEMCRKLEELVMNPDKREQMGSQGRKRVGSFFSIGKMIKNYESLYISMLEG